MVEAPAHSDTQAIEGTSINFDSISKDTLFSIRLEDLDSYEKMLEDPDCSLVRLEQSKLNLRAINRKMQDDINLLTNLVRGRGQIVGQLLNQISVAIATAKQRQGPSEASGSNVHLDDAEMENGST